MYYVLYVMREGGKKDKRMCGITAPLSVLSMHHSDKFDLLTF